MAVILRAICTSDVQNLLWQPKSEMGVSMFETAKSKGAKTMRPSINQPSARIYQFPTAGRAAVNGNRNAAEMIANPAPMKGTAVACGGAWYHDEAIQESERVRTNLHRFPAR
jgi:Protein of unknown function (DUF2735)